MTSLILASIGVFLVVIILLVIILLVAKSYLSPSGEVTITMKGTHCWQTVYPAVYHREMSSVVVRRSS